jgi:DNA-directed RNA polymerase subunit RPC12/RpoP
MHDGSKPSNVERSPLRPMKCPHCGQEIGIGTAALAGHAYLLRTQCEKCGKEFLIVDGFPMTEEQYSSHSLTRSGI